MPLNSWAELLAVAGDAAETREALPVGDYDVKVIKAEVGFTNNNNKKYALSLEVESGDYKGRKLWKDLIVAQTEGGIKSFFRQMAALGLDRQFFASGPSDDIITQQLVGKRAVAATLQKEWQGQTKNEVNWINAPRGGQTGGPAPLAGGPAVGTPLPAPVTTPAPVAAPVAPPVAAPAPVAPAAPPVATPAPAAPPIPPVAVPQAVQQPAPVQDAPPVAAPPAAPQPAAVATPDPWAATPPVMNGLGSEPDPF